MTLLKLFARLRNKNHKRPFRLGQRSHNISYRRSTLYKTDNSCLCLIIITLRGLSTTTSLFPQVQFSSFLHMFILDMRSTCI